MLTNIITIINLKDKNAASKSFFQNYTTRPMSWLQLSY